MCEFIYDKDFLRNKTVRVKTWVGQQCVEITDKDKTFRYLSNTIDIERLNRVLEDLKEQEMTQPLDEESDKPTTIKGSHYPNQEVLDEDKAETKEEFEKRICAANNTKTTPKSFEEAMYDKEPAKTKVYVSSYGLGGVTGNSFKYFKDTVKSFFDTKFGITNIEIISGEYYPPRGFVQSLKSKTGGLVDILNKMESADYIVLNNLSEFEKHICEALRIFYMMIPFELPEE